MNRRGFLASLVGACCAAIAARSLVPLIVALRTRVVHYVGDRNDLPAADRFYPMTSAGFRDALRRARPGDVMLVEPYRINGKMITMTSTIPAAGPVQIASADFYDWTKNAIRAELLP